jgi:beta-lactamase regulating signal transducer with metallopeptidase domain
MGMIGILWAGGTIFMLLKLCYGLAFIRGFRFGLKRVANENISSVLNVTAQTFHKQRMLSLYTSTTVESPITIGIIYPVIIIPEKLFDTLSEDELKSILLHEQAHIYHYDHLMGVIKRLIVALYWWNPLIYCICFRHTIAREEVADNYVLKELNPRKYSECLAGLAEKICLISNLPSATGMAGNYLSLEQRVKNILSKKRKLKVNTGFICKVSAMILCGISTLLIAGCQLQISSQSAMPEAEKSTKDSKDKILTGDYSISGILPDEFPDRENTKGMVILSDSKGYPPVFNQEIYTEKGRFSFTLPANKLNAKRLKAKIIFKSEQYAPLEAYCSVQPDKHITAEFRPLLKKQDAVHYYGECLDEITNKPIPYIGLYSDARGTEIGRADKNGHFDFYARPAYGRTHVIPWLGSDKYVGRSHFFVNKPGDSAELKLVVECGVRLRVKTVDEKGNPIPGVKVTWFGAGSGKGTTDESGNAHLAGMISRVRTGIISVEKDGYELVDDPGPLTATLYTEKPLKLVLRKTSAPTPLSPKERARQRGNEDSKHYARAELLDIESIYRELSGMRKGTDMQEKIELLIKKYPKANRTGCAWLYLAQRSSKDKKEKYLEEAIRNYGDCYYYDGVQVGAYARYLLGISFLEDKKPDEAQKLFEEIKIHYPDAIDHSGKKLLSCIPLVIESTAKKNRVKQDAKVYSSEELTDINILFEKAVGNWNNTQQFRMSE